MRLPFSLKNAPSIFQRALDDILWEYLERCCYVHIYNIIIFSKMEGEHISRIRNIFKTLQEVNIKVQLDKCNFFKREFEFLRYIITPLIKANPGKLKLAEIFCNHRTLSDFVVPLTCQDIIDNL